MRLLALALLVLTLATQYPLWWGKGGWLKLRDLQAQVNAEVETNQALAARNDALQAEVQDLKTGKSAVEERARYELNMIRPDEYFVQILPQAPTPSQPIKKPDAVHR